MSVNIVDVDESDSSMSNEKDFNLDNLSQSSTVDRKSVLCTSWSHLHDFFEFGTHDKKQENYHFSASCANQK